MHRCASSSLPKRERAHDRSRNPWPVAAALLRRIYRNLTESGPKHPLQLSGYVQPVSALCQPKPPQACRAVGRDRSYFQSGSEVPRLSGNQPALLCPHAKSTPCGNPGFCALCRQQRPGSRRVVRPHPSNRIKEGDAASNRMAVADRRTSQGRREYALLLFLYNTGARVSEAVQLRVRDLNLARARGGHDLATLLGKGGKVRQCPLWPETEQILTAEIHGRAADAAVFVSRLGEQFTRFGVYRLIERCALQVPQLAKRTITPHVIRHTTACHLVQAGVDINTIRAWLGHVSISTTNIYAEIDMTMKANAIALCEVGTPMGGRSWKGDKDLMAFLKSL